MAQQLLVNNSNSIVTDQPKLHSTSAQESQKWGTVIESIIDNLNNGGDKNPAATVLSNSVNKKNGTTKTNIYKRTFYESIYLGDLKPALHSETAKAFQTNDWQDISLNGNKIFENMDAENIGDLEDLIKKYHVCQYVIRLTFSLAESEKCNDFQEFMRMLEFVAKYIDDEKNGIAHTHATVKHHVSFNNSANIIIPSSARASMTTQSINLKPNEDMEDMNTHTNFLFCFPCHFDRFCECCSKRSTSPSKDFSDTMMDSGSYLKQKNEIDDQIPQDNDQTDDETNDNNKEELENNQTTTSENISTDPGGTD